MGGATGPGARDDDWGCGVSRPLASTARRLSSRGAVCMGGATGPMARGDDWGGVVSLDRCGSGCRGSIQLSVVRYVIAAGARDRRRRGQVRW